MRGISENLDYNNGADSILLSPPYYQHSVFQGKLVIIIGPLNTMI